MGWTERSGRVRVGDSVAAVNGVPCLEVPFFEVVERIGRASSSPPFTITFVRPPSPPSLPPSQQQPQPQTQSARQQQVQRQRQLLLREGKERGCRGGQSPRSAGVADAGDIDADADTNADANADAAESEWSEQWEQFEKWGKELAAEAVNTIDSLDANNPQLLRRRRRRLRRRRRRRRRRSN